MTLRASFLALPLLCAGAQLAAETITIEAVDGFRFIRCIDMFGSASCEFIAESEAPLRCIALDANQEPLAVSVTFARAGQVAFHDVPHTAIATMVCS